MFLSFFNITTAVVSIVLVIAGIKIFFLKSAWGKNYPHLRNFIDKNRTLLGFFATSGAVLGSLYYSEIVGYEPCALCWWQRIFIYSSAVVLLVALCKKRKDAFVYVAPLSLIGILFAINQLLLIWIPGAGLACDAVELCTKLYVNTFGFVSIPFMSFAVFIFLLALSSFPNEEITTNHV